MTIDPDRFAGDPSQFPREFRRCLGQFSTGVTVVTAEHNGHRVGVTANSFSSLSLDPPLILWSVNKSSRAFLTFKSAAHFAVSILAHDQIPVSQRFSSKEDDKFATVDWVSGEDGSPLIRGAAGHIECATEICHEGGDHLLIIGRVSRFSWEGKRSLIFSQGRYCIGVDHPDFLAPGEKGKSTFDDDQSTFTSLLFAAHNRAELQLEGVREGLGHSPASSRLYYLLSENPALDLEDLSVRSGLPRQIVLDGLADLKAKGDVVEVDGQRFTLTESGQAHRSDTRKLIHASESEILRGLAPDDVAITRRTLRRLIAEAQQ